MWTGNQAIPSSFSLPNLSNNNNCYLWCYFLRQKENLWRSRETISFILLLLISTGNIQYLPVDSSQHLCQLLLHQWPLISSDTCQQLEIQTEGTGEGPKKMMATGKEDFNYCIDNLENPSIWKGKRKVNLQHKFRILYQINNYCSSWRF